MDNRMEHYRSVLALIERVEREAAELIMHAHGILAEMKSGKRDVVTEYDRRVQELLIQRLREELPDAHFFCEELNERDRLDTEQLFIIDPIDGTMNFVRGFHHSCISVAYAERGVVRVGAVYNPYVDEMFTAVTGQGSRLNGRPIHVSDAGPLQLLGRCMMPAWTCAGRPPPRWTSAVWPRAGPVSTLSFSSVCGTMRPVR